ncbi:MAG TPA: DPP IV N-terminal domain-containing protein [Anaeromyxobacteraceae bacterium]|nr:DPP IV N-terminal domain-containing protein [Anaeromyxobacteraceae bacterium]
MTNASLIGLALLAAAQSPPSAPAPAGSSPPAAAPAPATPSFLRELAETRGYRSGTPSRVAVVPGGAEAIFLRSGPRSGVQSLYATDVATGATRELLTAEALLASEPAELTDAEKARLERQRITARGITHLEMSRDGRTLVASVGGRAYAVDRGTGARRRLPLPQGALDPRLSPDGRMLAFVSGGELHVLDLDGKAPRALTTGASEWRTHGLAEFVAQEEMGRSEGFWWSPDSRFLAFEEADDGAVEKLSIQDPARPERAPVRFAYPRAGRENTKVRLGVVAAAGGATTWVEWDRERWPYLARVRWDEGAPLLALVMNRHQTEQAVLRVDPATGRTEVLLVEKDPVWLNLHDAALRALPGGAGFLWFTERNGGAELEARAPDGTRLAPVAPLASGFTALAGVSEDGEVFFVGTGGDASRDRLFRVRPGKEPVELVLPGPPTSLSARLWDGGKALVVSSSRPGEGSRTAVVGPDGRERAVIPSVAVEPPFRPRPEVRQVGKRGLWTSLVKPRDFQPGRKYPVLVEVYGGPTHFSSLRLHGGSPVTQWRADQGFLVVKIVNRGETARMGRDFERAVRGDLAGPALEDQVEGLRALAAEVPEMDLGRVGITGWSFGGTMSALAALRRPDVYRAAVAGAPVVDWRDYDTFYTERYLGLPAEDPKAYERSSPLSSAGKGHAPLLLVHGTADDNVYLLHSLKLADALFRAGDPATFVPLANVTHLPADPSTAERLEEATMAFFRRHLGDPAP